jgi:hypothetical protein
MKSRERAREVLRLTTLNIKFRLTLPQKNVRWIFAKGSSAGKSEWFRISTPLAKKYIACGKRWVNTHFVGLPKDWERNPNGQLFKKGIY